MGMAAIPIAIAAVGAISQIQQSRSQAAAMENQADLADAQSETVRQNASIQSNEQLRRTRAQLGTQQTAFAANGVDTSTGSALTTMADTATLGRHDANTIQNNAALQAWGYNQQANQLNARARSTRRAGLLSAGTTLATGGYQGYRAGAFGSGGSSGGASGGLYGNAQTGNWYNSATR